MIGSDTLFIKRQGKIEAHVCHIAMEMALYGDGKTYWELLQPCLQWGNSAATDLTEEDVKDAMFAKCLIFADESKKKKKKKKKKKNGGHSLAGDGVFYLDVDNKKVYGRGESRKMNDITNKTAGKQ